MAESRGKSQRCFTHTSVWNGLAYLFAGRTFREVRRTQLRPRLRFLQSNTQTQNHSGESRFRLRLQTRFCRRRKRRRQQIYCVQPYAVKQQCVHWECISNYDNFSRMIIGFFICIDQKREESKSLERQRQSKLVVSISTKFRKVVQENRGGVLHDVQLKLDTVQDQCVMEISKRRGCRLVLIRIEMHDLQMFCTWYYFLIMTQKCYILMRDIWIDDKSHICDK